MRLSATIVHSIALMALASAPRALRAQIDSLLMSHVAWMEGPATGQLADVAQIDVPEDCRFTDAEGAKQFLEASREVWSGRELGVLMCRIAPNDDNAWFVLFTYNGVGLISDDAKASLNPKKLLAGLRRTNDSINGLIRQQGGVGTDIVGWVQRPMYDSVSHILTWSTRLRDQDSGAAESVSHAVRVLGRDGAMNIDYAVYVANDETVSDFAERIVRGFSFLPGHRYSDWHAGDRVSKHDLTALIAGSSGRTLAESSRVVVMLGAALVFGFLLWLVWTMRKDRRQPSLKVGTA